MKVDSSIRYVVKQFINDYLSRYGVFSWQTMHKFERDSDGDDHDIYVNDYDLSFRVRYGATKMCMLFDDADFVIKVPLYSNLDNDEAKALAQIMLQNVKRGKYCDFAIEEDYCKREAEYYADADEMGIGNYFAAEERIMTYHGVPVYVQEKIAELYEDSDRYQEDDEYSGEVHDIVCLWWDDNAVDCLADNISFVEDLYYANKYYFGTLLKFIAEKHITDLHSSNIGYDYRGRPKLIDYSGFC